MSQKALQESIKHWEENLAFARNEEYEKIETTSEFCALCQEYIKISCKGCYIKEDTGQFDCDRTPWNLAHRLSEEMKELLNDYGIDQIDTNEKEELIQAIEAELQYLKNLLLKISTTKS